VLLGLRCHLLKKSTTERSPQLSQTLFQTSHEILSSLLKPAHQSPSSAVNSDIITPRWTVCSELTPFEKATCALALPDVMKGSYESIVCRFETRTFATHRSLGQRRN
jgi:hypothetical protein